MFLFKTAPVEGGRAEKPISSTTLRHRSYIILVTGVLCALGVGYMVFSLYSSAEVAEFNRDYDLLSNGILQTAMNSLTTMNAICAHTAAIYSTEFPDPAMWPNVAHSRFGAMINPVVKSLHVKNINHIPLVLPEELQAFEDFAYDFFANDTESIPNLGVSPFGKGVWAVNTTTDEKFHDTTGETAFNSFSFLAPVFQVVNVAANSFVVMLNTHYDESRGRAIDACISCFYKRVRAGQSTEGCGALTGFLFLLQDSVAQPAAILYYPEFPAENSSKLTGFVGAVFNWDTILSSTVPNFKSENDQQKVVFHLQSSSGETVSYKVSGQVANYMGPGKLLENKYVNDYKKTGYINADVGTAMDSERYFLTVFPHEDMINEYFSSEPLTNALLVGCAVLIATFIIFYVEFFITSQVYEAKITSSLRRMFLRYVSHELRSPLNAVYMGISELLGRDEFHELLIMDKERKSAKERGTNEPSSGSSAIDTGEDISLLHVAKDIKRDTEIAMVVLDDLVTYVALIDGKTGTVSMKNTPVVCMRHIAIDCAKSIHHIFNDYGLHCSLAPLPATLPEGMSMYFTIRGVEQDLKLMFTYMLKVATKMCREKGVIELLCKSCRVYDHIIYLFCVMLFSLLSCNVFSNYYVLCVLFSCSRH
jgi:hypothetical protein